jgi:hypothetical protein
MITVVVENSWPFDLIRIYRYRHDFKKHYYDYVVSKVFSECGRSGIGDDLAVIFSDNHFSNIHDLDYKLLHQFLLRFFRSVQFATDNLLDWAQDPGYWTMASDIAPVKATHYYFTHATCTQLPTAPIQPQKMFGLHFLRPDTHRLGLLVSLYRAGLLDYVDVRVGVRSHELGSPEYRRRCNIDFVCDDFDISPKELLDLIDRMPMGDRTNFRDNATYQGLDHVQKDVEKNAANGQFVIELVCSSTCHDGVYTVCEKILRPMLLGQPWIYIGSADWYKISKRQHVSTFSEFWDESWDSLREDRLPEKIRCIVKTCEDIVDRYDLTCLMDSMTAALDNNRRLASCTTLDWPEGGLDPTFWL